MNRIGVVGAGLIGLAVARQFAQSGDDVVVLEKEAEVAAHQSGHNSGVVHAGVYYAPGSLKATLCRRGVGLIEAFCADHDLPYREIGKVVVARNAAELPRLRDLEARARANGVPNLRWLDPPELSELEPHVVGVAALHSPSTAIVDYPAIARAMAEDVLAAGGRVRVATPVTSIGRGAGNVIVGTPHGVVEVDRLVLCAGLQSDEVARLAGDEPSPLIVPFRGEYYRLVPSKATIVRGLVYPVPDPQYPFLGVHLTPRIDGSVDLGPNAVMATAREGYRRRDVNLRDIARVARWPGARRLVRRHWRTGMQELHSSLSTRTFMNAVRDYVPELRDSDVVPAPSGVRAQAVDADGSLVDDFRINTLGRVTAVRNAPSPAATSSLAIAEHIVAHVRAT